MSRRPIDTVVGPAGRAAVERAIKAGCSTANLRVLLGAIVVVPLYSKLEDHVSLRQIAEAVGLSERRAAQGLKELTRAGVLEYKPGLGKGQKSFLRFPSSVPKADLCRPLNEPGKPDLRDLVNNIEKPTESGPKSGRNGSDNQIPGVRLPKISENSLPSQRSNGTGMAPTTIWPTNVHEAIDILARRDLERTPSDVGNPEAWLAVARRRRLERHQAQLSTITLDDYDAASLTQLLERRPDPPNAQRRDYDHQESRCGDCHSGQIELIQDGISRYAPCPQCAALNGRTG